MTDTKKNAADTVGADKVQAAFDEANSKGFFGSTPEKAPNESFTLEGVTSKK